MGVSVFGVRSTAAAMLEDDRRESPRAGWIVTRYTRAMSVRKTEHCVIPLPSTHITNHDALAGSRSRSATRHYPSVQIKELCLCLFLGLLLHSFLNCLSVLYMHESPAARARKPDGRPQDHTGAFSQSVSQAASKSS